MEEGRWKTEEGREMSRIQSISFLLHDRERVRSSNSAKDDASNR